MPTAGNRTVTPHAAPLSSSLCYAFSSLHLSPLCPEASVTSHHSIFSLFSWSSLHGFRLPARCVCMCDKIILHLQTTVFTFDMWLILHETHRRESKSGIKLNDWLRQSEKQPPRLCWIFFFFCWLHVNLFLQWLKDVHHHQTFLCYFVPFQPQTLLSSIRILFKRPTQSSGVER